MKEPRSTGGNLFYPMWRGVALSNMVPHKASSVIHGFSETNIFFQIFMCTSEYVSIIFKLQVLDLLCDCGSVGQLHDLCIGGGNAVG